MSEENLIVRTLINDLISLRLAIKQYYFQKIKELELDVTYEMVQVMAVLWRETEVNQQDIADAVQKSKASVTPLIDNLCKRDLVKRIPNPNDRRNNQIVITEKGLAYQKKLEPIQLELYQRFVYKGQVKDLNLLSKQLRQLRSVIE